MSKRIPPREVVPRDDYYMALAFLVASRSKDPKTQIGAVIVSSDNRPLGFGYNGPPRQILDTAINWDRPDKYDFIEHAEENAIDHSLGSLEGATMYVTGKPCKNCMRKIVKHGIKKVIYFPMKRLPENSSMFANQADLQRTEEIARLGQVHIIEYQGNLNWMRDRILTMVDSGVFD
jgi:dCMP deaminase